MNTKEHNTFRDWSSQTYYYTENPFMSKSCTKKKTSKVPCLICKNAFNRGDTHSVEGGSACPNCFGNYFTQCSHCKVKKRDNVITYAGDTILCVSCLNLHYRMCGDCTAWRLLINTREVVTLLDAEHIVCPVCWAKYQQCIRYNFLKEKQVTTV
jgi:hypothetical protein